MEYNRYPEEFGAKIRSIRKEHGMNQVEFYLYLFPETDKSPENIKKKMNTIEHGKQTFVDIDLFMSLSSKCDVSADYLLGNDPHKNYDLKFVSDYTGLDEDAVIQLHEWKEASENGADLSIIGHTYVGDDGDQRMTMAFAKQSALQFLKIINYLFKGGESKERINNREKKVQFSNLSILHSLYLLTMTKPLRIVGKPLLNYSLGDDYEYIYRYFPTLRHDFERISLDASETMVLQDENETWYPLSIQDVFDQMARKRLDRNIDRLIKTIRE